MDNNSYFSVSNTTTSPRIYFIINIISLSASASGAFLSFVMLVGVLLRKKTFRDIPLLLCTNNYFLVFVLGIFELKDNVNTLRGDLGLFVNDENTVRCRIEAYILFSCISAVYLACVLQAAFRLCRIVYPTLLWLLNARTYLIIIPIMWITSFILVCPLYIWHGQVLIPSDFICRVPKDDPLSIAYSTVIVYGLPFNALAFTYFQVHRFLRRQTRAADFDLSSRSRRRQRDILVFRRIIIIVTLLGSYGMPNSVMLVMLAITGEILPSFYRILDLSFAACVLTLSVALIYVTPQLRKVIKICPQKPRVTAIVTRELNVRQRPLDPNRIRITTVRLRLCQSQKYPHGHRSLRKQQKENEVEEKYSCNRQSLRLTLNTTSEEEQSIDPQAIDVIVLSTPSAVKLVKLEEDELLHINQTRKIVHKYIPRNTFKSI